MTAAAPSGVVTFLFTDIEGSTRRWEVDAGGAQHRDQPQTTPHRGRAPFVSVVGRARLLMGQPGVTETRSIADALQRA